MRYSEQQYQQVKMQDMIILNSVTYSIPKILNSQADSVKNYATSLKRIHVEYKDFDGVNILPIYPTLMEQCRRKRT